MKTKSYPHVTGVYGDNGESPGALAVHAVLDPSPNYPESGRIIVGSPATTPKIPGYITNLGGFNGGADAIERLVATLSEAVRDVRAAMSAPSSAATTGRLDVDDLERKAQAATDGPWTTSSDLRDDGRNAIVHDELENQIADAWDNTQWPDRQCLANAQHIAAASPPVVLALIARVRELEAETAHQHAVMSEHATICNKRVAGIERIAKAATAFVDEQGKSYSRDLAQHDHFATEQYEQLAAAVEAGR